MKLCAAMLGFALFASAGTAQSLSCNMQDYKSVDGINAVARGNGVELSWQGEQGQQLQARFTLRDGQPLIEELAARNSGGVWIVLGKDLTPQFEVTTGRRRISITELEHPQEVRQGHAGERGKVQMECFLGCAAGGSRHTSHLVGSATHGRRDSARCCELQGRYLQSEDRWRPGERDLQRTNSWAVCRRLAIHCLQRLESAAAGGAGQDRCARRGLHLQGGTEGLLHQDDTKVVWRDTSQVWQEDEFGGEVNQEPVNVRARNRLEILDAGAGSLAIFPPPHKFFFARENEVNLGYVYYRKDNDSSFSLGVMQPERGEGYAPWGVTDEVWKRRVGVAREQMENYALYNAPPGTVQRMAVYYYLSPEGDHRHAAGRHGLHARRRLQAGARIQDRHRALPSRVQRDDSRPRNFGYSVQPGFRYFEGLGINIVYLGDFHDDSDFADPGPKRFTEQKLYFEARARFPTKISW